MYPLDDGSLQVNATPICTLEAYTIAFSKQPYSLR